MKFFPAVVSAWTACLFLMGPPSASAQSSPLPAGFELRGKVLDATTLEPIRKALVSTVGDRGREAVTGDDGRFLLLLAQPGSIELYVSTVGYGLLKREIIVPNDLAFELEILIGQEAVKHSDSVTVTAGVFEGLEANTPSEHSLNNSELKNLANVLVDDPLRSIQALPGVASSDDFYAQFAVRGSGFRNIGFYIDGVLTNEPFHTVRDVNDSGSLTILNGDLVDTVSLLSTASPAPYGDRTGATLNIRIREGSRERMFNRINLSATGISYTGEGPIGRSRKLSWLGSARKSYADWLIKRLWPDPSIAVALGFVDAQGKLSYAPSSRNQFTLTMLAGDSRGDRERERSQLDVNSFLTADQRTMIANGGWRRLQSNLVMQTNIYAANGTAENRNTAGELLFQATTREYAVRNDTSIQWTTHHRIETGIFVRRLGEQDRRLRSSPPQGFAFTDRFDALAWQPGFYAEDTWNMGSRVSLTFGGRLDSFTATHEMVALPRAGLSLRAASNTTIMLGYGQFSQFPDFVELKGEFATPGLLAERSTHYALAIEQRLTDKVRVRVEAYDKEERSLVYSEAAGARLVNGKTVLPQQGAVLRNTLAGYSRGVEIYLQRRSANRLAGWISYAIGYARYRDHASGLAFDGDFDQRHTASTYLSYRLTKALSVSSKFRYGSNFPVPRFVKFSGSRLFLSDQRSQVRLPGYSRLDARVHYAFHLERWKLTLYSEVTNVLNRRNVRFANLDSLGSGGRVLYSREYLLPFLPSAGITIEF